MTDTSTTDIGTGTKVFEASPVQGTWRRLSSPDDGRSSLEI